MDKLLYILTKIDTALGAFYYKDIIFNGLARLEKKDGQTIPAYYKGFGDYQFVGFDDTHGLNIYYRVISESENTDKESGFGRSVYNSKSYQIKMVAFGNQREINDVNSDINYKIADKLSGLIPKVFTKVELTNLNAVKGNIELNNINHDKPAVFSEELPENEYTLSPESLLFSIQFTINVTYLDNCKDMSCEGTTPLIDVSRISCDNLFDETYGLTTEQLLVCILPEYDFADEDTLNALTPEQNADLIDALCNITCVGVDVTDPLNPASPVHIADGLTYTCFNINTASCPYLLANLTASQWDCLIQNVTCQDLKDNLTSANLQCLLVWFDFDVAALFNALLTNPDWLTKILPYAVANATCQQLNNNLTDTQRNLIYKMLPPKTGQTTSYAAGDDGALQNGRGAAWGTLSCNNNYGNTNRFVTPIANYTQDWQNRLAWYTSLQPVTAWANIPALLAALNATLPAGFGDYYLGNANEHLLSASFENGNLGALKTSLNVTVAAPYYIWTSTTNEANNTYAWALYARNITQPTLNAVPKITAFQWICVRQF